MAIYTPRGLKIRLSIPHAFALVARLYPRVSAFRVLKTTEGLESVPDLLAMLACLASFVARAEPLQIGLYTLGAAVVGKLITLFGFYIIPGLPMLGTMYSYASGFGVLFILVAVAGFVLVGWQGVVAFLVAKLLAGIVNTVLDFTNTYRIYKQLGIAITTSQINFFNAYRLHASKLGETTDISVSDEELNEENWREAFEDLATSWPEVVSRFRPD